VLPVRTETLVGTDSSLTYWAANRDLTDDAWATVDFDNPDGDRWQSGVNGVGYDDETPYRSFIQTNVRTVTFNRSPSVLLRFPFHVASPEDVHRLRLQIQYDDGFTVYLNGTPVALRAAVLEDGTRADARFTHPDALAVLFHTVDLTSFRNRLLPGENMLGIRGMNDRIDSSDMLFRAVLEADVTADPGPAGFAAWILSTRPPDNTSEALEPGADADGDGASNVHEFYFGGNAWDSGSFPLLILERDLEANGASWRLKYRRLAESWVDGFTYRIEVAQSLEGPWRPVSATTVPLSGADLLGHQNAAASIEAAELLEQGSAAFLRVVVTQ
jgi:hypothetical protein